MTTKTLTIDSWLRTHARHQGAKTALNFEGRSHSYAGLATWVEQLASGLQHNLGLNRGDRIAFYGKNSDVEVALMFAAARLGLTIVPLNWRLAPAELNYVLRDCSPRILFHDAHFADQIDEVLFGLDQITSINTVGDLAALRDPQPVQTDATPDDPYMIVYTSGTTGRPKGAVMTQTAIQWNAIISLHAHDFTPDDHVLNILPLFHVGGINIQMMPCFFIGGQVTLHAQFEPETTVEAMENQGITMTICVPTVMKALLRYTDFSQLSLPSLRLINTGSTDVPVDILETVHKRGIPMVQVYGATETGPFTTYQKAAEAYETIGSIGRCAAHCEIKLIDDDGQQTAQGEPGEIWVRGPNNFSYYWNNPQATADNLVDGWFRTGDVAYEDEQGLYWFADRVKHVIISGGENIYPAEVERILNQIPGIHEATVVGKPHPRWGEVPVAVVVVEPQGPGRDAILAAFGDEIARYKHPKDVVFLDHLPRNSLGKVVASDVRALVIQADEDNSS